MAGRQKLAGRAREGGGGGAGQQGHGPTKTVWCLVGNGGMDPFSSPYITPNSSLPNPFPHSLLRTRRANFCNASSLFPAFCSQRGVATRSLLREFKPATAPRFTGMGLGHVYPDPREDPESRSPNLGPILLWGL